MDKKIIDIIIVLLSFRESILLGVVMVVYVLYKTTDYKSLKQGSVEAFSQLDQKWKKKHKIVKDQLDAVLDEDKEAIETEGEFSKPQQTPEKVVNYGGWMIEDFGGYYVILDPDLKAYPKIFHNIVEVHKIIDTLSMNTKNEWKEI